VRNPVGETLRRARELHHTPGTGVPLSLALPCLLVMVVILILRGICPLAEIGDLKARNRNCHKMFQDKMDGMCKAAEPGLTACADQFMRRASKQSEELRKWVADQSARIVAEQQGARQAMEKVRQDLEPAKVLPPSKGNG